MRTLAGYLKVGRSNNVSRRCRELSAEVVGVWTGLGRLEPTIHRHLEDFRVSREVFDCPFEAIALVVCRVEAMDHSIKVASRRLHDELGRWRGTASTKSSRPIVSAGSWLCGSSACSIASGTASGTCGTSTSSSSCSGRCSEENACEAQEGA